MPLLRADERPTKVKPEQPGGMKVPDQNVSLYNDKPGAAPVEKLLPQPEQPMRAVPRRRRPRRPAAAARRDPMRAAASRAPRPRQPAAAAPACRQAGGKAAAPSRAARRARCRGRSRRPPPDRSRCGSPRCAAPEAAREEWSRLKQENADLLGNLRANAVRADLGDKGIYYRIQAGPFADAAAAERLCAELKRRNHGCILAR